MLVVALWIHAASLLVMFFGTLAAAGTFSLSLVECAWSTHGVWILPRGRGYRLLVSVALLIPV